MENKSFIVVTAVSVSLLFSIGAYATSANQKATAKKQTTHQTSTKTVSSLEKTGTTTYILPDIIIQKVMD